MSRIQPAFARLAKAGRKALIPFVTAGDPSPESTVPLMQALAAAGADVIELGVPFSDPMADGPVIQRASERALRRGVSLDSVLGFVREFRRQGGETPVVLMGYANPIEAMGADAFVSRAKEVGVDGVLVVDYTPEESDEFAAKLARADMDMIFLLAPTSTPERIGKVASLATGYIYYVSLKGVTGSAALDVDDVARNLAAIRTTTSLPLGVGFGIRDAASARAVAAVADAVVIGSRIIQEMEEAGEADPIGRAKAFLAGIRVALDDAAVGAETGA